MQAGLIAGLIQGLVSAPISYYILSVLKEEIISEIRSNLRNTSVFIREEQIFNLVVTITPIATVVSDLLVGLVVGIVYAVIHNKLPIKSHIPKATTLLLAIALALLPSLLIAAKIAGLRMSAWLSFFIGGAGWFIALLLRIISLQLPVILNKELATTMIYGLYASLLAGLFEESMRFLFYKHVKVSSSTFKNALSFGLGWGFFEAVMIYTLPLIGMLFIKPIPSMEMLFAGAVERNSTVITHVALSFMVLSCIGRAKLLIIPILTYNT